MDVMRGIVAVMLLGVSGLAGARGVETAGIAEREGRSLFAEWLADYSRTLELKSLSTYLRPAPSSSGLSADGAGTAPEIAEPQRQELDRTFPMW